MSKVSIFGLGYVGAVTLAVLADNGHRAHGVDVSPIKVEMINEGRSPIIEAGLDELLMKGLRSGTVRAGADAREAVLTSEISIICVGTPSNHNGSLDLTFVRRVSQEIGAAMADKDGYHIVALRSTVLPGTTQDVVIPILEAASGKKAGRDFGVCFNPEFLREGTSIKDFHHPPYTIIGTEDARVAEAMTELYSFIDARLEEVPIRVAEMIKYTNNAFHALKVTFANEIGAICKQSGIDSHQVMELVCLDTKLNLSPYYLKPGFAFGGSCLPKDLRALMHYGHHHDLSLPVLEAILPSNNQQIDAAFGMVSHAGKKRVGVLGFSFKAGTDDLRESPIVELIERLIGKGYQVKVYDKNVALANLHGANRAYIEQQIPHIASLMSDSLGEVLETSELIIVGNNSAEFAGVLPLLRSDQTLIDLVRITDDYVPLNGQYHGIGW